MKKRLGIESDYALAPRLGLTKQAISKLRNRPLVMSNSTAAKIAAILELEPLRVIADAELERGSDDQLWRKIRSAAVLAAMAVISTFPAPAEARFNNNFCAVSSAAGTVSPSVYGKGGARLERGHFMHCMAFWRALLQAARALAGRIGRAASFTGAQGAPA